MLQSLVEIDGFLEQTGNDLVALAEQEAALKEDELKERVRLSSFESFVLWRDDRDLDRLFKRLNAILLDSREADLKRERKLVETDIILADRLFSEGVDSRRISLIFKDLTSLRKAVGEKDSLLSTFTSANELVTYRVRDYVLAQVYN